MASVKVFIFFGLLALGFLIPSEVAATNVGTKSSPGRDEGIANVITLVTDADQNLNQTDIKGHKSMRFDVRNDDYETFIQQIRDELRNSDSNGIPVLMPQRPETPENAQWLDIVFVAGGSSITLRLEQSNLYVRGYQRSTDNFFWEFTDTHLIAGSRDLFFSGSYTHARSIVRTADVRREELALGRHQLENSIHTLAVMGSPLGQNAPAAARNLLVLIQMIAEGTRYRTISEHIGNNYWTSPGVMIDSRMVAMENGWGQLSTSVLQSDRYPIPNTPLPNIPSFNPTQVYTFGQALAALGILLITLPRGSTMAEYKYGRSLMNLEYVRINNIDGENPGDLFGTVRVNDGWFTYTFYDRSSGNYETVRPGGYATLTDSGWPFPVSGADALTISVDLYDYDTLSPNDKIAQGDIVWDRWGESVSFENYDKHLDQVVRGEYGDVTVGYSVLIDALTVTIEVILEDGDGENPADVYGTLTASQLLGGWVGLVPITLFQKPSWEYVEVRKWQPIPLTRKVIAASISTKLKITADLWDYDSLSSDDEIAKGSVEFRVQPGTQRQYIYGRYGHVQVIVAFV